MKTTKLKKCSQTGMGQTVAPRKSRIPSRAIYNAPPLCPKLPFVEYPGNRQYLAQLPPLATPLGVGWQEELGAQRHRGFEYRSLAFS